MSSASTPVSLSSGSAERFFQASLYLLLVMGFAALAGTGKLDFLSLALGGSALVLRGYHLLKARSVMISERWTTYLTIFYFLFYLLDYFFISQGFVNATVHMVLYIMVIKIFSVQRDRDLMYLAVLAFLMVLAAAVLTVDTVYLLTFCMFMLAAVATFISMEMRRSEREMIVAGVPPQRENKFQKALTGAALILAALVMAGGAGIFFALPRMSMGGGYLRNLGVESDLVSGFSGVTKLGGIGKIQQSNAAVMHIQVTRGRLPADTHWRGLAQANFDGQRWWNPRPEAGTFEPMGNVALDLRRVRINGQPLFNTSQPGRHHPNLAYRVIMEPVGTNLFFLAETPVRVNGPYRNVAIATDGAVYNAEEGRAIGLYEGEADTTNPVTLVSNPTSNGYPPAVASKYLQLPNLDPRIPELARSITARSETNYARARDVEAYLQGSFGYTLELPATEQNDPLAHFLFERKKGHCEYFASAMAIMMRTLGIPSRLVTGFRGAEFNDLNQTYIVRGRDAHAWVEVYFPEYGWVTFDPTPGSGDSPAAGGFARLALYLDVAREIWREWIINYDFNHQVRLSTELGNRTNSVQGRVRLWYIGIYSKLLRHAQKLPQLTSLSPVGNALLIVLIVALGSLPFSPRAWRAWQLRKILRDPGRAPGKAASFWYMRMLKMMEGHGIKKTPAQTPEEFVSGIADPKIKKDLVVFTEHYERARFGDSAEDAQRLPGLLEAMTGRK
ncbi:MAG TPA: DUF3488 and transglutaminase-like domain-containing protein [Candidatus Saccharimonadales bacterium]|nr:DUF3488 and transglutaminase-like domain-containing protein [Candidatus Saccharimonadales bacterium]